MAPTQIAKEIIAKAKNLSLAVSAGSKDWATVNIDSFNRGMVVRRSGAVKTK